MYIHVYIHICSYMSGRVKGREGCMQQRRCAYFARWIPREIFMAVSVNCTLYGALSGSRPFGRLISTLIFVRRFRPQFSSHRMLPELTRFQPNYPTCPRCFCCERAISVRVRSENLQLGSYPEREVSFQPLRCAEYLESALLHIYKWEEENIWQKYNLV